MLSTLIWVAVWITIGTLVTAALVGLCGGDPEYHFEDDERSEVTPT